MTGLGSRHIALRLALAVSVALQQGACTSGGNTLFERIGGLARHSIAGSPAAPAEPAPAMTRAELDQIPYATAAFSKAGGARVILVPVTDNGGYLNYRDPGGDSVIMFGGAVSGSESLGFDLQAVQHQPEDPIAHQMPLADWPGRLNRVYQYLQRDLGRYVIALDCVYEPAVAERIEIFELVFDLMRVNEVCTNAERQIINTYWVDAETGFIWKSEQWVGPQIGHVTIEIIRPYSG
ncbi:MAG TPA: YjbF family lipoprotein [candidate division Zixibacteria bacterium]|nr:YjbF family lipoprotein [candidate division Zixibacteria bacterium]